MNTHLLDQLIDSRNSLFNNATLIVPEYQLEFWRTYKLYAKSDSLILTTREYERPQSEDRTALFYSGGAESTLTKALLDGNKISYDVITLSAHYRKSDKRLKDEFWYMSLAFALGYQRAFIGLEKVETTDRFCFEWTTSFYDIWNKTFGTSYTSLLFNYSKIDIYHMLDNLNLLESLNVCKHNNNCQNCWKCFKKTALTCYIHNRKMTSTEVRNYKYFIDQYQDKHPSSFPYRDVLDVIMPHII